MAARYPEVITSTQVSIPELERALEDLIEKVAHQKGQLAATFEHIHQMVFEREEALMAELDAIPAGVIARVEERRASLKQLSQLKEETERQLQANRLNAFLQQQLSSIRTEMERVFSDQILFPRVSLGCQVNDIQRTLEENFFIQKIYNPFATRTLPVWSGVKKGEGSADLNIPTALCIDPDSQLIYVAEFLSQKIQVFTQEGKHHSTLHNKQLLHSHSMKIHRGYIYISTSMFGTTSIISNYFKRDPFKLIEEALEGKRERAYLCKLNKKGGTIRSVSTYNLINGLFIATERLYTCTDKSLTLQIYTLNLETTNQITLNVTSENQRTPKDVIVNKQQIIVLFCYQGLPSRIHIFQVDGTLICSLATKDNINYAYHFCLDSYENILVSDYDGHCLRIISPDGFLLQSIGRKGKTEPGELWYPLGVAVDSKGRIIIVDEKDFYRLQAF